jgi:hypothetical protein
MATGFHLLSQARHFVGNPTACGFAPRAARSTNRLPGLISATTLMLSRFLI